MVYILFNRKTSIDEYICNLFSIAIVHGIYVRRGHTPLGDATFHKKRAKEGNVDYENLTRVIDILNKHGKNSRDNDGDLVTSIPGRLIKGTPSTIV